MIQSTPINIIIADDHELFRDGFKVLLNKIKSVKLVAEAGNGEELIQLVQQHRPDIVITDIKMPLMDGITATRLLSKQFPQTGIIALSMFEEENLVVDMLEAGAKGYLLKNAQKAEILHAITEVYHGNNFYCAETNKKLINLIARSSHESHYRVNRNDFNERELSIIRLICQEMSNREIAEQLNLSKRTVEGYRDRIMEKIGAKNSIGIVIYALRHAIYKFDTDSVSG
jgi:DNA-binding NarL/FixJ family response regulator